MTLVLHEARTPSGMLFSLGTHYVCDEFDANTNLLDSVFSFRYRDVADIHLLRIGAAALAFLHDGPLSPVAFQRTEGSGIVPDEVMEGQERALERQRGQVDFATLSQRWFSVAILR